MNMALGERELDALNSWYHQAMIVHLCLHCNVIDLMIDWFIFA